MLGGSVSPAQREVGLELELSSFERQRAIHELIERDKRVSVAAICEIFSVSEATARRDLAALAMDGRIQRVRGGAIKTGESPPELPILEREDDQAQDKEAIGRAAAKLVKPGETIFLGSGTTVLATTRYLQECQELTVLTNSLPIVNLLVGCNGITLIVLGGMLRNSELSFIGHITERALSEVRADKVIMGARAISLEHGITNDYLPETLTDRAIIKMGREVILVADHTKFGSVSTAFLAPLEDVTTLVTDRHIEEEFVQSIEEKGVNVLIAQDYRQVMDSPATVLDK
jgi:DeoR family transcriptional regulator, aga operon transcriptional repressor